MKKILKFLRLLGPGVVTGAADDDPSGIATYSQSGAQFGFAQLWTMLPMLPMMIVLQELSARIGIAKGAGLAKVIKDNYPAYVLYLAVGLMVIANTVNLAADLSVMGSAVALLVRIPAFVMTVIFAAVSLALQVLVPYSVYSRYLKWLAVSLFAYVLTGIVVAPNWLDLLKATFIPHIRFSPDFLMLLVGLLGTTISPYLFFWQASQEVEERIESGEQKPGRPVPKLGPRPNVRPSEIRRMRRDTLSGMIFSQVAAWFIIVTAAGSLHKAGITDVNSADQAAKALVPLVKTFPHAGLVAEVLFASGIVGLGLLAIPVFVGANSYAISESFGWRNGLFRRPTEAPQFYLTMVIGIIIALLLDRVGVNPIKALIYAAVVNGVAAVPLIALLLLIGNNKSLMGRYANPVWSNVIGWITFALMAIACVAMFATIGK